MAKKIKLLLFKEWIMSIGGIKELSKQLNLSEHTIRFWLRGEGTPEVETIIKIINMSRGTKNELNFDIIYKECTRNKTTKNK